MKSFQKVLSALLILSLFGCATIPEGPSVTVLPTAGKPFDLFQKEDAGCRQWAGQRIGMDPEEIANQNTATGATVGAVIGAGIGGLLGAASGHPGAGMAIGAGTGLLFGSAAGSDNGRVYGEEAQRRYDNAYLQCMYSYGNQVQQPVRVYRRYRPRYAAPPPPPAGYYYDAPAPSGYYPPPPNMPPPSLVPPDLR